MPQHNWAVHPRRLQQTFPLMFLHFIILHYGNALFFLHFSGLATMICFMCLFLCVLIASLRLRLTMVLPDSL